MVELAFHPMTGKTNLVIRETADKVVSQLTDGQLADGAPIVANFAAVAVITPSFAEQLIRGIKARLPADAVPALQLRILHAPPHTARTFTIVGRAHGMVLEERSETEWLLRPRDATDAG